MKAQDFYDAVPNDYSKEFSFLQDKPRGTNLEGYIFPDTYQVAPNEDVSDLIKNGKAYYCFCTQERINALPTSQEKQNVQTKYDKHCLHLSPAEIENNLKSGIPKVVRLNVISNEKVIVDDFLRGRVEFDTNLLDDQVLIKSDGYPTYHLAVVVDDHLMQITHVIRGEEWAMSRFQVVHFATHALIDHERPARSGLVLSRLDTSGPDGIVTGDEIAESWRLDANLVTLSACQTAVGRSIFGDGVVGLSYPLLGAGARSLLVSQWKVDDEATSLLMERFYRNWLGKGAFPWSPRMNKASALREAQHWLRDYRDLHGRRPFAHPIYWAAFVLVGDPG